MAKSKKPRKSYKPGRWNPLALMIPQETVNEIKDMFMRCEMSTHLKLGRGEMTEEDIQCLRDFINFATTLIHVGRAVDNKFFLDTYGDEWDDFIDAFHSYRQRFVDTGTVTATGDEMKAIRSGVVLAGHVVQGELDAEMFWCIKCFLWMKDVTRGVREGKVSVDFDGVEREIEKYGQKGYRKDKRP